MRVYQGIAVFLLYISSFFSISNCKAQIWKGLKGGFGCTYGSAGAYGFELEVDEDRDCLLLSGELYFGKDCKAWRMPAMWNGHHWIKMGEPDTAFNHISFKTIGTFNGDIYSSNPIAGYDNSSFIKWNGYSWDTISGGSTDFSMYEIKQFGDYLYVVGAFTECANESANLIYRFDGEKIEPLVDFFESTPFGLCMEFYKDTLYVGGYFSDYTRDIHSFASVYNHQIHRVSLGLTYETIVEAMCVHDGVLWIGGSFASGNFGVDHQTYLAYYDGEKIHPSPWQPDGRVTALKSYNNELYIAGRFGKIEGVEAHCLAKINDFGYYSLNSDTFFTKWGQFGSYMPGIVRDMEIWKDTLYITGDFGSIGRDTTLNTVAKLNRSLSEDAAFLQSEIILYPNPAHDQFILETGTYFNQPASIVIFDAQGRLVMTESWPAGEKRKQVAVENLENGLYLVVVETNEGRVMIKRILKV